jgi:hypothetical protein
VSSETIERIVSDLLEPLAAIEHARWSHWQRYMHSKCVPQDGALVIPAELVQRWERQLNTPYAALTDKERESDREQVRVYLPLIQKALRRASTALARKPAAAGRTARKSVTKKRKQAGPKGRKKKRGRP